MCINFYLHISVTIFIGVFLKNINLFILTEVNYFTIFYWFRHTSTCICHKYTRVPHPEPLSLLPPCTIPLGRLSAPAPSMQYRALNLDWQLISYMILYMFQCHSPNFMAAVTICSDFGDPKNKISYCFHCFPIYFPWK